MKPWNGVADACTHLVFCSEEIVADQFVCKDFGISRELEVDGKECA